MFTKNIFRLSSLCLVLATSIAAYAEKESTADHWISKSYVMNFSGNLTTKEERNTNYKVETIFTDVKETNGNVAFTCINGVMAAAIAAEPVDFASFIEGNRNTRGWRTRKIPMIINGKQHRLNDWTYLPNLKILMPRKKSDRAKIYNSAIRQDKVVLAMDFKAPLTLILPKPNKDFSDFAAICNLGKKKKK